MAYAQVYPTRIGPIGIVEHEGSITHLFLNGTVPAGCDLQETPLLREAAAQLYDYLDGKRKAFSLPLSPSGTDFQRRVWDALCTIPYGEHRSYEDIAIQVGNPKACRAVGLANARNPIAIYIPCHRVIGKNGTLTGFGGGLPMKEALLCLERGEKA